jgi:hypothetical protein
MLEEGSSSSPTKGHATDRQVDPALELDRPQANLVVNQLDFHQHSGLTIDGCQPSHGCTADPP